MKYLLLIYYPIHVFKVTMNQSLDKNLYRLKFLFKNPSSVIDHFENYRIRKLYKTQSKVFKNILDLNLGHNVEVDEYCQKRVVNLQNNNVDKLSKISLQTLEGICPSDQPIIVHKSRILSGNGRVTSLLHAKFKGRVEVVELM